MSARHIHLSERDVELLFGSGYRLIEKRALSQPGQYACEEKVEVVGSRGSMKMSVLGPVRENTQVEISLTDARVMGLFAPVRESGDIAGSGGCKLVGPAGEKEITEGVIVAKRHVHMTPEDAAALGVRDKEMVGLQIETEERSAILGDVIVRVSPYYATAAHIDTDEANAIGLRGDAYGRICKKMDTHSLLAIFCPL
ncbi:MAG TPA: propanediol utilization protein [Lachnospiraceae bacterium]|nr:propanediol utilization protein [Lachnospiraceae bacterium]